MMHEPFRELLALDLYDELTPGEVDRLNAHLASCAACRGFEVELAEGLGCMTQPAQEPDLSPGWAEGLRTELSNTEISQSTRGMRSRWNNFAAGLVAGLAAACLGMAILPLGGQDSPAPAGKGRPQAKFAFSAAPPLAVDRSRFLAPGTSLAPEKKFMRAWRARRKEER